MSDVAIGEVQHFPLGVSDDIAQGLIDFQPAAIGGCQRHADGGIVECAVDACLEALPPRPPGGGGGGGGARAFGAASTLARRSAEFSLDLAHRSHDPLVASSPCGEDHSALRIELSGAPYTPP